MGFDMGDEYDKLAKTVASLKSVLTKIDYELPLRDIQTQVDSMSYEATEA